MIFTYINYTDIGSTKTPKGPETYHIAKALEKNQLIDQVITRDSLGNLIPKTRTFVEKYVWKGYDGRNKSQLDFDKKAAKRIDTGAVILGISGLPQCAEKAKKLIVFATSAHPKSYQKILQDETGKITPLTKLEEDICKVYAKADLIFARSHFNKKTLTDNGIDAKKIKLIWNGVDLERFHPKPKEDNTFRVLFMANAGILKGLHYLLQVWKSLNLDNANLVIAGRILDDMKDVVNEHKDDDSISFVGHVDPTEWYYKSDVVVLPSLTEGSPMVLLEAMACARPVISFENSGAPNSEKSGFIVPNRDVQKLKEKIKFLYDNPEKAEEMGLEARKEAEQLTYENYTKKIVEGIKECVELWDTQD